MFRTPLQRYDCVYRHGISSPCAAWSLAAIPEWMILFVSPTCSLIADVACNHDIGCSTIPAHNRRSMHISSRCIAPLELIAVLTSQNSPFLLVCRQRLKRLFVDSTAPLWISRWLCYSIATLKIFDWHWYSFEQFHEEKQDICTHIRVKLRNY